MATWGIHMMIVDDLLDRKKLGLDERGFVIGNIAPDCNVENQDWTGFTPPREVTHWMRSSTKLSADYEGFYQAYIQDKSFASSEEEAFMYGYYCHLIVDVSFQRFIRDNKRIEALFDRLRNNPEVYKLVEGQAETLDTVKAVFGREQLFHALYNFEARYLLSYKYPRYQKVLLDINQFPDYIDYLPEGAITRKIKIMTKAIEPIIDDIQSILFSEEELEGFIRDTSEEVYGLITDRYYLGL